MCDKILNSLLEKCRPKFATQLAILNEGKVIDDLGSLLQDWKSELLVHYDQEARRYIQSVATTERRQALIDSYHNEGLELFTSQLRNLRILLLTTFDDVLEDAASKEDPEFDTIISEARSRYEDEFTSVATRTAIDSANWDWEYALKELQSGLSQRIKASNSERKATEPLSASKAEWVHSDQLITSKVTLYRDGTLVVEVEADNDDSWQGPSWTCSRCSP